MEREDVNGNRTPLAVSALNGQRIPRAFPIPSKRSGCRFYLATLHTLPEIGSWQQCLVTEEDLRIISQAGFRLAAPLWNQIQASGRSSMFARFRIEKMEDSRWRTRYHGWDDRVNGTDTIAGKKRRSKRWKEGGEMMERSEESENREDKLLQRGFAVGN